MSLNWTNVKSLAIPVGGTARDVKRVSIGGVTVWEKNTTPTARDYVQAGLVAMWDGIENAGWGTHDANATVWKDLIGSANMGIASSAAWGVDCLTDAGGGGSSAAMASTSNSALMSALNSATEFTIEMCAQKTNATATSRLTWISTNYPIPLSVQSYATNTGITFYSDTAGTSVAASSVDLLNPFTVTIQQTKSGGKSIYFNGQLKATNATSAFGMNFANLFLGREGVSRKVFALRISNKLLTASEIARRAMIDRRRFGLGG